MEVSADSTSILKFSSLKLLPINLTANRAQREARHYRLECGGLPRSSVLIQRTHQQLTLLDERPVEPVENVKVERRRQNASSMQPL